jgi:hypothetical protein
MGRAAKETGVGDRARDSARCSAFGLAPRHSRAAARALLTVSLVVAAGGSLAGCGGASSAGRATAPSASATASTPSATPRVPSGPPSAARVIRRWADTLRRGDEAGAAALFALPAIIQTDPAQPAVKVTRRAEVIAFDHALPCGAIVLRTERRGAYVEALFRLVQRPGATCDGPGGTARTAFKIRDGKITEWRRRLDDPDDSSPRAPAPSSPSDPDASV